MLSDVFLSVSLCLSVAYIGPKSRTERSRKTKIDTEVAHVTLRCSLVGGASRFGAHRRGEERGGAYRGSRPPAYSMLELASASDDSYCKVVVCKACTLPISLIRRRPFM